MLWKPRPVEKNPREIGPDTKRPFVVIVSSVVAFAWSSPSFAFTGKVQSGFPTVEPPSFELYDPTASDSSSNSTDRDPMSFTETLSFMGSGPVIVAFIAILQNVAVTKFFGSGQTIDGTQEMLALGATNIRVKSGGFFSCIPVSGSFNRSIINDSSGVKTQLGGGFVGGLEEKIREMKAKASEKKVPIVFSGNRYILGKPCFIKSQVSAIAILDKQGAEELFRAVIDESLQLTAKYEEDFN